jgi:hypothetical protein
MLNGEAIKSCLSGLTGLKGDCGAEISPIDDGVGGSAGAGDGDGFAFEVDVLVVGAGGYEDGVAGVGGVDAGLDGGLGGGDVDDGGVRPEWGEDEKQKKAESLKQGGGAQGSRLGSGMKFFVTLSCVVCVKNASFVGGYLNKWLIATVMVVYFY